MGGGKLSRPYTPFCSLTTLHSPLSTPMTTLTWGDPQLHFWLRHARKAQEPIQFFGEDAETIVHLLEEQMVSAHANPDATQARRAGMIGLTGGELTRAGNSAAQVARLTTYYHQLHIGGKLVLIVPVPDIVLLGRATTSGGYAAPMEALPPEREGEFLYRWRTTRCNPVAQQLSHHDIYEATNAAGTMVRRWHRDTSDYYAFPNELRLMLERVGYQLEAGYGGWNDEPMDEKATLQVWVARKGV